MKTLLLAFVAFGASSLFGASIYVNTVNDTGNTYQYSVNNYSAIGDQITLAGTERFAIEATTQFFNVLPTAGFFDATLALYSVGSAPDVLGTQLVTSTMTDIAIPGFDIQNPLTSGTVTVTFSGLNVIVPDELIFVLTVANVRNADLGVTIFDEPTVGFSDNAKFISAVGSAFSVTDADPGYGNLNFSLTADAVGEIPEPATLPLMAAGLAALVAFRRRQIRG